MGTCCPTPTPQALPAQVGMGAPTAAPDLSVYSPWYVDVQNQRTYIYAAGGWAQIEGPIHWMDGPLIP